MAWVATTVTGAGLASKLLDRPLFLADHQMRQILVPGTSKYLWTKTGNTTDADETDTDYPAERAWDGFSHLQTRPQTAQATWYFAVALPSQAAFDTVFLSVANSELFSDIWLEISDHATFSSHTELIATFDTSGPYGNKLGVLSTHMGHALLSQDSASPESFTAVDYVRLVFMATSTAILQLGESSLGSSRQLLHHLDMPYGDKRADSSTRPMHSRTGVTMGRKRHKGRAVRDLSITTINPTEHSAIDSFWSDCDEGSRSFVWMENPGTAPAPYLCSLDSAVNSHPLIVGANRRQVHYRALEQPPFRDASDI